MSSTTTSNRKLETKSNKQSIGSQPWCFHLYWKATFGEEDNKSFSVKFKKYVALCKRCIYFWTIGRCRNSKMVGNLVIPWFAESYNSYGTVTQLREVLQSQVEIFILFKTFPILLTFFTFLQHCRNKRHFIFTDIFIDTCHIYWYFVILTMEWEKCSSFKESYKITSKPSLTK